MASLAPSAPGDGRLGGGARRPPQRMAPLDSSVPRAARSVASAAAAALSQPLRRIFPAANPVVAPKVAPAPLARRIGAPPAGFVRSVGRGGGGGGAKAKETPRTHKFIVEQKAGWTFSDMLRDKKELEALRRLRTELLLEGDERAALEGGALKRACALWGMCGCLHGGHWLFLAAKANDPRLVYLADSGNRALGGVGALKKVDTMIRTLEQHHDTVNPDPSGLTDTVDEDSRRRRVSVLGASGLRAADRDGKSDPYAVVRWDDVWVGQTDPAFKTLEPRWEGASFEVEIPKGRPGTLVVEVYDFDAASANDFLGQVTIEVEDTGKDGRDTAEQVEPTRHPLLSKSGRQRRGEITLLIESAEPTEWIPGDLKSMRAEMARIFKMRNDLSSPDDDETESSPVVVHQVKKTGPQPSQLLRHAAFYWLLLLGTWLLRLLCMPGTVQCQVGAAQQRYLIGASCLLHEQPTRVGVLYVAHLFCLLCTLCHWIFDALTLVHTTLQVMHRERLTLPCTRQKSHGSSFALIVATASVCGTVWGLVAVGLINECVYTPCQNGGTCLDLFADYKCACVAGWKSRHCETDINECLSKPCLNAARCTDSTSDPLLPIDAFSCACARGYANGMCLPGFAAALSKACTVRVGAVCDWDLDECLSFPCQRGSICIESSTDSSVQGDAFACQCREGWANGRCDFAYTPDCSVLEGGTCATDINECISTPCKNGAVCTDSTQFKPRDGRPVLGYKVTRLDERPQSNSRPQGWRHIPAPRNSSIEMHGEVLSKPLDIGFAFPLFESAPPWRVQTHSYSALRISPNGFVAFEDQATRLAGAGCCPESRTIPHSSVGAIIAPCWGDFSPAPKSVSAERRGDSFVVSFDQVPMSTTCRQLRVSGSCSELYNGDYFRDQRVPVMNGRPRYVNAHGSVLYWAETSFPKWRLDTTPDSPDTIHAEVVGESYMPPLGARSWNVLCDVEGGAASWSQQTISLDCMDSPASQDHVASWRLALFADGTFLIEIESCPPHQMTIGWQSDSSLGHSLCSSGTGAQCSNLSAAFFRAEPQDGRNMIDTYSCSCAGADGWGGENCEDDYNECASSPCSRGATCTDSSQDPDVPINAYRCSCAAGYAGGVCVYNFLPQYAAACSIQLGGNCEVDVDECVSAPCRNGATCTDSAQNPARVGINEYSCSCVPGFAGGACIYSFIQEFADQCSISVGGNCDLDVNECASNPCRHNSSCADSSVNSSIVVHAYTCTCMVGYTNGLCDYTVISEYAANCTEARGNCDVDVNECASSPCMNGAPCTDSTNSGTIAVHAFACACRPGWANGVCALGPIAGYESQCSMATGGVCDLDIDECASNPCENGARCTESTSNLSIPIDSYRCSCTAGYANGTCAYSFIVEYASLCNISADANCDVDVNECVSTPCRNNASCTESNEQPQISLNAYRCSCVHGYANGLCAYDFISEYSAECNVLESHDNTTLDGNCDMDVDECESSPCAHNSICHESNGNASIAAHTYRCECGAGFANGLCNYTVIPQYRDQCAVFQGGNCDLDVDECASNPCSNGAYCTESRSPPCHLDSQSLSGSWAEQCVRPPSTAIDIYSCTCPAGWANGVCATGFLPQYNSSCTVVEGGNCDLDINECVSNPCANGATCVDSSTNSSVAIDAYDCLCAPGWTNGICAPGFLDQYAAACHVKGGNCDIDINECVSSPCVGQAKCSESTTNSTISIDAYSCSCPIGWANGICAANFIKEFYSECTVLEGGNCDVDINECRSAPCQNGATCTDSNNNDYTSNRSFIAIDSYSCACSPGWVNGMCAPVHPGLAPEYVENCGIAEGANCDLGIDECISSPCERGSVCLANESAVNATVAADNFSCACLPGWGNGVCAPGYIAEYETQCTRVNGGVCDLDINECASSPCMHNGTCTDSTLEPVCALYGDNQCCEEQRSRVAMFIPYQGACAYLPGTFYECGGSCVPKRDCAETSLMFARLTLRLLYGLHCNESLWSLSAHQSGRRLLVDAPNATTRSASEDSVAMGSMSSSGSWAGNVESGLRIGSAHSWSGSTSESGSWMDAEQPIRWSASIFIAATIEQIQNQTQSMLNETTELYNASNVTMSGLGHFKVLFRHWIVPYFSNVTSAEGISVDGITAGSVMVTFSFATAQGDYRRFRAAKDGFAALTADIIAGNETISSYAVLAISDVRSTPAKFTFAPCLSGTYEAVPAFPTVPPICRRVRDCSAFEYEIAAPTRTTDRVCLLCNQSAVHTYAVCTANPCNSPCSDAIVSSRVLQHRCSNATVVGSVANTFSAVLSAAARFVALTGCGKTFAVCPSFCRRYQRSLRHPVPWRYPMYPADHVCTSRYLGPRTSPIAIADVDGCFDGDLGQLGVTESISMDAFSCGCKPGWANGMCAPGHIVEYTHLCYIKEGGRCDVDINECVSFPCLNGATCRDSSASDFSEIDAYVCDCARGWEGEHCEVSINPCASRPANLQPAPRSRSNSSRWEQLWGSNDCHEYARCLHVGPGVAYCECLAGTAGTGQHCVDIDECLSNPCANGGICSNRALNCTSASVCEAIDSVWRTPWTYGLDAFYCTCASTYHGHECQFQRECTFGLTLENSNRDERNPCSGMIGDKCNYTCSAGHIAVGEHVCDGRGGFSGGRCVRQCFSSTQFVQRNDYLYGLLSGAAKAIAENGCDFGRFMPLPSGWELAPATTDFLAVAQMANWNTHVVEASNGWSAYTANHGPHEWFCNDSKAALSSCNVLEKAGLTTQWNLEDKELSWSDPPPYSVAWKGNNFSWTWYDLSLLRVLDSEKKTSKLQPRGKQWSIPTTVSLGRDPLSCVGSTDALANCPALVNAVGCTAVIDVGQVVSLCFATCCASGQVHGVPGIERTMTSLIPIGFSFPYFDKSFEHLRVSYTGLVHLTNSSDLGTNTTQLPAGNGTAMIAPFWEANSAAGSRTVLCKESSIAYSPTVCAGLIGSNCSFACEHGYTPRGYHMCDSDGHFVGGSCTPNLCTAGNSIPGSTTTCTGVTGAACNYICTQGYVKNGSHICGADGNFSGGSCVPDTCRMKFSPFIDNFDDASVGEWIGSAARRTTTCGHFGTVLGGFQVAGKSQYMQITYDLTSTPHHQVHVDMNFIKIDGYRGQQAQIYVDGRRVWTHTFAEDDGQNICGSIYRKEMLINVSFSVTHTADLMTLMIKGASDANPADEYFAIDNVHTVASSYHARIAHSSTVCNGHVGDICIPVCDAGYSLTGTHVCNADAAFSGGTCVPQSCFSGLHLAHSPSQCSGVTGDVCNYTCEAGYSDTNPFGTVRVHRCGADGVFRGGQCLPTPCFQGNSVNYASNACSGSTGDVCSLSCDTQLWPGSTPFALARYRAVGMHTCGTDGVFAGGACVLSDLCDINIGCATQATCVQTTDPSLPQYVCICNVGYWGSGTICSPWTECVSGTSYEVAPPILGTERAPSMDRQCAPVTRCGPGYYESRAPTVLLDRQCGLCRPGSYQPNNDSQTCNPCPVGTYDHDLQANTTCVICPSGTHQALVGQVACAACAPDTVDHDADPTTYCVPCAQGYSSQGGSSLCRPNACTLGLTLPHSSSVCSGTVGAMCNFACDTGFSAIGRRICTRDGAFVGGQCTAVPCQNAVLPQSPTTCSSSKLGAQCHYKCNEGYVVGAGHVCGADGIFRGGSCSPAQCSSGLQISRSPTICSGVTHDLCHYTCDAGFVKQGVHKCGVDGVFRGGSCTVTTLAYAMERREKLVLDFRRSNGAGATQVHWQLALSADGAFEIVLDHDVPSKPHPADLPDYVVGFQNHDGSLGQTICSSSGPDPCISRNDTILIRPQSFSVGACDHRVMLRKPCRNESCYLGASCSRDFCGAGTKIAHSNRDYNNRCSGLVGRACPYVCDPGYKATADHVCQADGVFRGGGCVAQPCAVGTIANSNRNASNACFGYTDEVCPYTCSPGYSAMGTVKCQPDGSFGGGYCRANPCIHGLKILNSDKIGATMKTCSDLRWTNAATFAPRSAAVCSRSSDQQRRFLCSQGDYLTALGTCQAVGARLCSADELHANEAADAGCGHDNHRVWSSSKFLTFTSPGTSNETTVACGANASVTMAGKSIFAFNYPVRCALHNESLAIRCCADVMPGCMGGTDTVCDFTCDLGYTKEGSHVCGVNGYFSGGRCTPNPCFNGTIVAHSNTVCSGNMSQTCPIKCVPGYAATGAHICQHDGVFRGGKCEPQPCTSGLTIAFATAPCAGVMGDVCNITCIAGYTPTNSHVCEANGSFVGGSCEPDNCTTGLTFLHSVTVCNGTTSDVCNYACEAGWTPDGQHVCRPDHAFRGGSCKINSCATSYVPDSPTQCRGVTGDVCTFSCSAGYSPRGVHTCQPDGHFAGGTCLGVPCAYGITLVHSPTVCTGLRAGDPPCNYTCNAGYTKSGNHVCGRGGRLSGGSCVANTCADFRPPHSNTTCSQLQTSQVCDYSCDTGFTPNGTMVCGGNGTFVIGYCQPNLCTVGRTIPSSQTVCDGGTLDVCDVRCDAGFTLVGQHVCGSDGIYRGGECRPNPCNASQLVHSPTVCQGSTHAVCSYACNPGYSQNGSHVCGTTGTFTGGTCQPEPCTSGNNISHSLTTCSGVTTDVCNYACSGGFVALGTHTCGTDNVWAGGWCLAWMGVVAYTSFEEPARTDNPAMFYQDNPPSGAVQWWLQDHLLPNNVGQNPVAYTRCTLGSSELGFQSYYMATGGYGLTDGDRFGVVGDASTLMGGGGAGTAPHGQQYFLMEDTDGFVFVVLDSVAVAAFDHIELTFWMLIDQATWEYTDSVKVWVADSSGQEVTIFSDTDMDDQVENSWIQHSGVVHDTGHRARDTLSGQCTVIFGSGSSSGSEGIWFDYFQLTGYAANPILAAGLVGSQRPDPCTSALVVPRATSGCTDSTAHNYKPWATSNDGSCIQVAFDMYGCGTMGRMASAHTIQAQPGQFYLTPATHARCAQRCLGQFGCVSFAYSSVQNRCYLKSRWDPTAMLEVNTTAAWTSYALRGCTVGSCGGVCP